VYGVDEVGNMNGTMYGKAVAEGNFLPVGQGTYAFPGYGSPGFAGRVTVSGLEGRPLWLFVFGNRDPDCAETLAFCSDSSWLCPPDNGQIPIDASTATTSVFGSFGPGGAIQVSGLPFPEPPVFWLLGFGLVSLIFIRRLTRSRVEKANSYHYNNMKEGHDLSGISAFASLARIFSQQAGKTNSGEFLLDITSPLW